MKRVSFEVAKALKDAGYPQFSGCHYYNCNGERFVNPEEGTIEDDDYFCPTAIEVWLWLWRKKNIHIDIVYSGCNTSITSMIVKGEEFPDVFEKKDLEEAILAAIDAALEYLSNNRT